MLHMLSNPTMLYFWAFYAIILGMFWQRWLGACYSYVVGVQAPQLAWSVQGFVVAGVNTKRGGVMYTVNVRLG